MGGCDSDFRCGFVEEEVITCVSTMRSSASNGRFTLGSSTVVFTDKNKR